MAISKRQLRKIVVERRVFWWRLARDWDDPHNLYSTTLMILSDDRRFHVVYSVGQQLHARLRIFGPDFPRLPGLKSCSCDVLLDMTFMIPSQVRRVIDWCLDEGAPIPEAPPAPSPVAVPSIFAPRADDDAVFALLSRLSYRTIHWVALALDERGVHQLGTPLLIRAQEQTLELWPHDSGMLHVACGQTDLYAPLEGASWHLNPTGPLEVWRQIFCRYARREDVRGVVIEAHEASCLIALDDQEPRRLVCRALG